VLGQLLRFLARRRASALAHPPAMSVGMAAHGNSRTTRRALDALFASVPHNFELILVDDKSPDDTLEVFREARRWHANTRIFSFDRNLDYCESVNAILSHARGDYVLFLSNDIFASPAYLRELLRSAAANPGCGILRGCSNFVDKGSPLHMVPMEECETREKYFALTEEIAARHRNEPLIDERFLVGDAFLVSRRGIDRIGTFDTRFIGYFGDLDFGLRARIAGFRVVLERRAFAFHQKHGNIAVLPPEEQQRRWQRRRDLVDTASQEFLRKYDLRPAVDGVDNLPWDEMGRRGFDAALHYIAPKDYSAYLLRD
jgi:GT2 family glycosyltransferase